MCVHAASSLSSCWINWRTIKIFKIHDHYSGVLCISYSLSGCVGTMLVNAINKKIHACRAPGRTLQWNAVIAT